MNADYVKENTEVRGLQETGIFLLMDIWLELFEYQEIYPKFLMQNQISFGCLLLL